MQIYVVYFLSRAYYSKVWAETFDNQIRFSLN